MIDGIALLCAHPGRADTLTDWVDPSITDEHDILSVDPELDMYDAGNGPPYDAAWLGKYRAAQLARNERLTDWVLGRLAEVDGTPASDHAFVVHRTMADPRFLDLSLDPNDREIGTIWGEPRAINYAANNIGRFTTLRSFLSQWSKRLSRADGPKCLANTTVPVLNVDYTADQCVYPSQIAAWSAAAIGRCQDYALKDVGHYPHEMPEKIEEVCDVLVDWADRI